jgi:hypothetical protein
MIVKYWLNDQFWDQLYNWHDIGIKNWEYIEDYYRDERISLIAKIRD